MAWLRLIDMLRLSQSLESASSRSRFKDGFQVTWNFLESFQLSDFNEMQSKVTWGLNILVYCYCSRSSSFVSRSIICSFFFFFADWKPFLLLVLSMRFPFALKLWRRYFLILSSCLCSSTFVCWSELLFVSSSILAWENRVIFAVHYNFFEDLLYSQLDC